MGDRRKDQAERMARYAHLIEQQAGKAVRPFRADGYVNLLNRYGTQQDTTERYRYQAEPMVPDELLTMYYEGNGLFAKIIDTPAEEAIKHGFHLEGLKDQRVEDFFNEALDELDWEETAMTAIRWARLFGGSIAVMLINDGRGLEEPLDWRNIRSIDDIRVYDRSVIQPEEWSMFSYDPQDPFRTRGSRLGMPERYHVSSRYGSFVVHDSRCLVFQNGILPENTTSSVYQLWGIPEYVRIQRAIRDAEIAHGSATKLLDRSVQAVYKMKDLAAELATEEGEDRVLRRLQTIDMARGLLNSITIDSEGEDYDFRQFQFSGVSDVIDSTCNFLSALTSIPQTILFGRSPAGMNATGDADLENWYNALERIQKRMVKKNLRYLLSVVFQAGVRTGEVDEVPKIKITFNPLWSLSDMEQADLEQKRAQIQLTRAQTAQTYIDKQVIDPSEVRKKLADSEEFDVENMLDEYEDEDLFAGMEGQIGGDVPPGGNAQVMGPGAAPAAQGTEPGAVPAGAPADIMEQGAFAEYGQGVSLEEHNRDPGSEGEAPAAAPAATKLPQDMSEDEKLQAARASQADESDIPTPNTPEGQNASSVGVLVISDGKILTGTRHNDFGYGLICGPGGHVEPGETPTQAAFRETEEEFGISPKSLIPLGRGPKEPETGLEPYLFLCTEYEGEPDCVDLEMAGATFRTMEELEQLAASMFQPFADGLEILKTCIETALFFGDDGGEMHDELVDSIGRAVNGDGAPVTEDGDPGSGSFGHGGRPGEIGGRKEEIAGIKKQIAEGDGFSFSATPNYYRCPACGETYGRPFGERKNRPIRRCLKCGKVVTMQIDAESTYNTDDDVDWVTINGTHTPLKDGEAVGGGKLKGMSFKGAKSVKKTEKSAKQTSQQKGTGPKTQATEKSVESPSARKEARSTVEGSDVIGSYTGDKGIKSALKAQGFDGLPKVVSKEEFDEAVKESGFIAQRTYTASSQEVLEAYREMLYNGEWYVDCAVGGAQYGQGMYCAADWSGELSKGIQAEMAHYQELGTARARAEAKAEYIRGLTKEDFSANIYAEGIELSDEEVRVFTKLKSDPAMTGYKLPEDEKAVWQGMVKSGKFGDLNLALENMTEDFGKDFKAPAFTETMTLAPGAKVIKYNDITQMQENAGREYVNKELAAYADSKGEECAAFFRIQTGTTQSGDFEKVLKWQSEHPDELAAAESFRVQTSKKADEVRAEAMSMDVGAYAALKGYDAINAESHGESGSYTVILNRTKTIILDGSERSDSTDDGVIRFQDGGDGLMYAIRNGKIIGWLKASDGTEGAK